MSVWLLYCKIKMAIILCDKDTALRHIQTTAYSSTVYINTDYSINTLQVVIYIYLLYYFLARLGFLFLFMLRSVLRGICVITDTILPRFPVALVMPAIDLLVPVAICAGPRPKLSLLLSAISLSPSRSWHWLCESALLNKEEDNRNRSTNWMFCAPSY